jgi:hypothetical protein
MVFCAVVAVTNFTQAERNIEKHLDSWTHALRKWHSLCCGLQVAIA